ncbi:MAG: transposase [Gammaproteobacteria bacterium]|nr:transposase [Gammaproteobacteria bacterium]
MIAKNASTRLQRRSFSRWQQYGLLYRVVLHFLPPHSLNDNPIERLWEQMQDHVMRNRRLVVRGCRSLTTVRATVSMRPGAIDFTYRRMKLSQVQ